MHNERIINTRFENRFRSATASFFYFFTVSFFLFTSCTAQKNIGRQADSILLKDSSISKGHIGISIYEPATNRYWYDHDAEKYFVPGSNTKLFTLYAGMKYLGDSLPGIKYQYFGNTLIIYPTADPTFLHEDFLNQPVVKFLQYQRSKGGSVTMELNQNDRFKKYGTGWAWDDSDEDYMAERSSFPFYGNRIKITINKDSGFTAWPTLNLSPPAIALSEKQYDFRLRPPVSRERENANLILINKDKVRPGTYYIPFVNYSYNIPLNFEGTLPYADSIHMNFKIDARADYHTELHQKYDAVTPVKVLHSQPSDSIFTPMMHRSDNFFAEQTLLMISNERLGYMNDVMIIDTLLATVLKDVPQKPNWVDGSGLSRYNLFTPRSFIYILNKMKNEFGMERLKTILPTGGEGTLSSYYKNITGRIFAKTGTLGNHCSLSGFLYTKKGKLLIFSILANHYPGGATPVRRAMEKFLEGVYNQY